MLIIICQTLRLKKFLFINSDLTKIWQKYGGRVRKPENNEKA